MQKVKCDLELTVPFPAVCLRGWVGVWVGKSEGGSCHGDDVFVLQL